MKLNPDCVRDVLLYLEENLGYTDYVGALQHKEIQICTIPDYFSTTYSKEDVNYSIEKLYEARFISLVNIASDRDGYIVNAYVNDITYIGHEFLNNIRPKNVWDATKEGASKLGLMSMHALSFISSKVIESIITNPTVINKIIDQTQTKLNQFVK